MHYKSLFVASKEFVLDVNADPHMVMSRDQNAQQNQNILYYQQLHSTYLCNLARY
jgi:hypothetical protein